MIHGIIVLAIPFHVRLAAHPVFKSFLSGSISGFCSTVLFQPFDLVKTRLQAPSTTPTSTLKQQGGSATTTNGGNLTSQTRVVKGGSSSGGGGGLSGPSSTPLKPRMSTVFVAVVRQDGVLGLWRGLTPSLARTVPGVGLYFGFLHSLKSAFHLHQRKLSSKESFMLGATCRVSAAGMLCSSF